MSAQTLKEFMIDISVRAAKAVNELMGVDKASDKAEAGLNEVGAAAETARKKLHRLAGDIQEASQAHIEAGGRMAAAGAKLTVGITAPLTAFGASAFKAASDAAELQSAFNQTFGPMANMMNAWAEKTGNAMGRSTQEMQSGANAFGLYFNQAAKSRDEAAKLAQDFTVLAQDLSSFHNTSPEEAMQALRSGLSGETEPLRRYGVFLNDAAISAKAAAMGIKGTNGKLTDQQKIMARAALIMDATANAQGDVIRTSAGTANQIRAAQSAFQELQVVVGTKLLPALTPLIAALGDMIRRFTELPDRQQKFIMYGAAMAAALGPVVSVLGGLRIAYGALIGPIGRVMGFFTRFSDATRLGIALAFKIRRAFLPVTGLFRLFSGALRLLAFTPWGRAISLLILAGTMIYQNWDQVAPVFRDVAQFLGDMWASVQPLLVELQNAFTGLWNDAVKPALSQIGGALMEFWQGPAGTAIKGVALLVGALLVGGFKIAVWVITAAVRVIVAVITAMVNIVSGIIRFWTAALTGDWSGAWEAVKSIFSAAWDGILGILNGILPGITGAFAAIYQSAKTWLQDKIGAVFDWFAMKIQQVKNFDVAGFVGMDARTPGARPFAPLPTPSNSPLPSRIGQGGKSLSMNNSGNVTVHVQGGPTPAATGRAVAGAISGRRGEMLGAAG